MRLSSRANRGQRALLDGLIRRYRQASFALLVTLASAGSLTAGGRVEALSSNLSDGLRAILPKSHIDLCDFKRLWGWVIGVDGAPADLELPNFDLGNLEKRRAS